MRSITLKILAISTICIVTAPPKKVTLDAAVNVRKEVQRKVLITIRTGILVFRAGGSG